MVVREISSEVFKEFSKDHPQLSFWQTEGMAKRREYDGWTYLRLGFYDNEELVGASIVYRRKILLNKYTYECFGGPLIDYNRIEEALSALKVYLEGNGVYDALINPNVIAYYHNLELDETVEANDFVRISKIISESGFTAIENVSTNDALMNSFYKKDLSEFKDLEELNNSFERETRRLINNSQKLPLIYEELDSNFERIKNLVDSTADIKQFRSRTLEYYETLYKHFNEEHEIKMVVVSLDVNKYRKDLVDEAAALEDKIIADLEVNTKRSVNRANQSKDVLNAVNKKLALIEDVNSERLDLCAGVFFFMDHEATYLIGGSDNRYFSFNGPQFMQWEIIKEAYNREIKTYDFYGTRGSFNGNPDEDGVYYFKKGFNGYLVENYGFFVYESKGLVNQAIRFIKKIRG